MSTLSVENLQHPSSSNANITLDSNGNINLGAGSASLPSITAQGDTNTGIYFPAADNIGFATGGTIRGRWTDNGLCFGTDTAAANALDDYEEGTWTPNISAASGSASGYTVQSGVYTKIGDVVVVSSLVQFTKGTLSGSIVISNLPFSVRNSDGAAPYVWANWYLPGGTACILVLARAIKNSTQINFYRLTAANIDATASNLAASDFDTGASNLSFSMSYYV